MKNPCHSLSNDKAVRRGSPGYKLPGTTLNCCISFHSVGGREGCLHFLLPALARPPPREPLGESGTLCCPVSIYLTRMDDVSDDVRLEDSEWVLLEKLGEGYAALGYPILVLRPGPAR